MRGATMKFIYSVVTVGHCCVSRQRSHMPSVIRSHGGSKTCQTKAHSFFLRWRSAAYRCFRCGLYNSRSLSNKIHKPWRL